jgi:hypothetical protein
MIGMANATNGSANANGLTWEEMARQSGVPQNEIDRLRATIPDPTARATAAANDPAQRQAIEDNAARAAWYSFLGTLVSMLAAAVGGFVGSGPSLRLFTVRVQQSALDQRSALVRT